MKTRVLLALTLIAVACESSTETDNVPGVVTIDPPSATLSVGATIQLRASVTEFSGDTTVQWLTLDGQFASVTANGTVTALAPGVADIVARVRAAHSVRATARVVVPAAVPALR